MKIAYADLKATFKRVLLDLSFEENKAELCAGIFADNSRDGVYSHGINRFPVFVAYVKKGWINIHAEPALAERNGLIECWDGHLGPGMYNATVAMNRAIEQAQENGIGCVALKNTNHWMRGGTYGWQAAKAGCIGICFTNTIPNMPPWGGIEPRLGNNPLVISVPFENGQHIVLDMAMSQYSYGKLQENSLQQKELSVPGGFDEEGKLTTVPSAIIKTQRALPVGFWKGSGLSLILDVLLTAVTGGQSVKRISEREAETGLSQFFLCLHQNDYHEQLVKEIIAYTKSASPTDPNESILYPGERTLAIRMKNEAEGIPVNQKMWEAILAL
ncbi:MAG: 3-dehydro-L-gulonate 2-dehydrogenase [Bacteroidota bacterium]|nr:3-dehydro-L-gulonate 2-dehydrogenase [Bacteroidota bacterium]